MAGVKGSRTPLIVAAILAGAVLRLAFGLAYWVNEPLTRDEQEYLSLARSLAARDGFVYDAGLRGSHGDPFGRAPGYPVFLAAVGGGAGPTNEVPVSVKVAQALVGAIGVGLVAVLAGRLAGPRAAVVAAWIAAAYPPLVAVSARAFSETVFWPLALGVAWMFDRASRAQGSTPGLGLAAGALAGVAVLVRPALLLFVPIAVVWALWRRRPVLAVACLAGAALVIGPWTARNYAHYGRFVLVASEGGVTFWTGNHPLARGDGDLAANPDLSRAKQALRARYPDLSEEQMEPVYVRDALAWMRAHPLDWLALEARKVFYLVVPIGPSYQVHSARYYAASAIPYLIVLGLTVVAATRGTAFGRTPGLWLLAASSVAACLIFFPSERFRIPIIDPVLVIAAGGAFATRAGEPAP